MTKLESAVNALPEFYQPIYGHQELNSSAARNCYDRLDGVKKVCTALSHELKRPLRILELGCAQGFFSMNMASWGGDTSFRRQRTKYSAV